MRSGQPDLKHDDVELTAETIPAGTDPRAKALLDYWQRHCPPGAIPSRRSFDPYSLKPWIGHISILAVGDAPDAFTMTLEGGFIESTTGENWTGRTSLQIDETYQRGLTQHLRETVERRAPVIHAISIFQKEWIEMVRLLLPISKTDGATADEVFLCLFK